MNNKESISIEFVDDVGQQLYIGTFNVSEIRTDQTNGKEFLILEKQPDYNLENESIYLQTKSNYKDNGIYEDNETDD